MRVKKGVRVTVTEGPFKGASGRVIGRHDAVRFTILFQDWVKVGSSLYLIGHVFGSSLGSYVVPKEYRPVSVGALQHPVRRKS